MNKQNLFLFLLVFLVLNTCPLYADSCYSIELLSVHKNHAKTLLENKKRYPQECRIMQIGEYFSVRCGCYERIKMANEQLPRYHQVESKAFVTLTKRERFASDTVKLQEPLKKSPAQLNTVTDEIFFLDDSKNLKQLKQQLIHLPSDLLKYVQVFKLPDGSYQAYASHLIDRDLLMSVEGKYRKIFPDSSLVFLENDNKNMKLIYDYKNKTTTMKRDESYVKPHPLGSQDEVVSKHDVLAIKKDDLSKKHKPKAHKRVDETFYLEHSKNLEQLKKQLARLSADLLSYVQVFRLMNGSYSAYTSNLNDIDIMMSVEGKYRKIFPQSSLVFFGANRDNMELVLDYSSSDNSRNDSAENTTLYDISYYGESQPKVANTDDIRTGTAENRRVEIEVYSAPKAVETLVTDKDQEVYNYGLCTVLPSSRSFKHKAEHETQAYLYKETQDKTNEYSLIDFNVSRAENLDDVNHSFEHSSITELMATLKKNNTKYLDILHDKDPFLGLYIGGKYENYVAEDYIFRQNVDYEYRLKLRWEIFNDGYFESKKNIERKVNETEIQYLQLLSNMTDINYDDKLFDIQGITLEVRYKYYLLITRAYEELLVKREQQLREGFTTIDDVYHVRERLENFRMLKEMTKAQVRQKVDRKLFLFLNSIECVELVEKAWLKSYIKEHSTQLQLQDRFIQRSEFFPEFSDKLKVNLFTEHRKVDTIGWYDTAGIQVDIPIDWNDERRDIIKLEQANYKVQKRAMEKKIDQGTDSLYYQFDYQQKQLKILKNSLKYLYQREEQLNDINQKVIQGFKEDPSRASDLVKIKIIDKKYEILMKRIGVYEILLRLYHLSNADNIKFLIKNRLGE